MLFVSSALMKWDHTERHKVHLISSICTWWITEWMKELHDTFTIMKKDKWHQTRNHASSHLYTMFYLFPFLRSLKSSVMTMFQTCAAEEPPVGYFEARRVPGAELLRDALVSPAPERNRSAQCGRTIDSNRGLQSASTHYCYHPMHLCVLISL